MTTFDPSILSLTDEAIAERYVGSMERLMKPDLVIAPDGRPYLYRWWITPKDGPWGNVGGAYFHIQVASDPERPLHDHPWDNFSVILSGGYNEIMQDYPPTSPSYVAPLRKGDTRFRLAETAHRLILPKEFEYTMTLFTFGPKVNEWGFYYPEGKRSHKEVTRVEGNISVHVEEARVKAG